MSIEVLKLIVSVQGSLVMILLGIIAFFLRAQYKAIQNLREIVPVQKRELELFRKENTGEHNRMEHRLNKHSDKLDEHGNRINKLERNN